MNYFEIELKNKQSFERIADSLEEIVSSLKKKESDQVELASDNNGEDDSGDEYDKYSTKAEKILRFIEKSGQEGRKLWEIQKFILQVNYPDRVFDKRNDRGYYCTNLLHNSSYFSKTYGLLHKFCKRNDQKRWVLTKTIASPYYRK